MSKWLINGSDYGNADVREIISVTEKMVTFKRHVHGDARRTLKHDLMGFADTREQAVTMADAFRKAYDAHKSSVENAAKAFVNAKAARIDAMKSALSGEGD